MIWADSVPACLEDGPAAVILHHSCDHSLLPLLPHLSVQLGLLSQSPEDWEGLSSTFESARADDDSAEVARAPPRRLGQRQGLLRPRSTAGATTASIRHKVGCGVDTSCLDASIRSHRQQRVRAINVTSV